MPLQPRICFPATLMPLQSISSVPLPLFMPLQSISSVPLPLFMPIHPSSHAKAAYVFRPSDSPRNNSVHLPLIIHHIFFEIVALINKMHIFLTSQTRVSLHGISTMTLLTRGPSPLHESF